MPLALCWCVFGVYPVVCLEKLLDTADDTVDRACVCIDLTALGKNAPEKKMILGVRVGVGPARGICLESDHPLLWLGVVVTRCMSGGGAKKW